MLAGTNLKNVLLGGTRGRELRDTRARWERTQALWRASPLVEQTSESLAVALVKQAMADAERVPALPVLIAACEAIEGLYRGETIGELEVRWPVIEENVEAALEFRQMLARRARWAADFPAMNAAFGRIVTTTLLEFFRSLPESCFGESGDEDGSSFEVPLVDLLDDPAAVIDKLFLLPYDTDSFRLDLFFRLRELCANNLLIASGFTPATDIRSVERKLLRAPAQKDKTGAELAEIYLNGSPLKSLIEQPVRFRLPDDVRFEHCHIVGGTGHGKTQLLQTMIHADLKSAQSDDRSVIVIDSQGDLIGKLTRLELFAPDAPQSLADRLVIVDPSDVEYPAALNLFDAHLKRLDQYRPADRERVLNGVIELYELFFGAFLGAELTQKQGVVFKYLARLMLAIPGATIHTLMQIMEDGQSFRPTMDRLDGSARHFFETEFFHPSFAATKKQVLRRLWGVLSTPAFERMFTQKDNKLDLFEAMNDGKIVLVSTAKDLLKREGSALLGRFFIAMIAQAALERSTLAEENRTPVHVYIDEAQEYFDDSIETILNQARKYRVGLTLAHQTLDQLSPRLRSAMLANTSIKCAGGVSAKDARALADELHTTSAFIEGMKRKGPRSEFALWVKNRTGQAIRFSVPLGFLEGQPSLTDEDYDALVATNRARHCGSLADIPAFERFRQASEPSPGSPATTTTEGERSVATKPAAAADVPAQQPPIPKQAPAVESIVPSVALPSYTPGKGGARHRYLQSLVKELAEQQGLKATIEAPTEDARGQVDVLIERDGVLAAVEISVTTPVEHEIENLRKCLACNYPRIAVVLAKSRTRQQSYQAQLDAMVSREMRERIVYLVPEDLPTFIASLAASRHSDDRVVRGYRVTSHLKTLPIEEARMRQDLFARFVASSLRRQKD